ncbi:MAG: hypothetical protein MK237_03940 [Gemmatimonadetes bacterium]|nr:hypothetical protein [Gemmatimonadota bacterium]
MTKPAEIRNVTGPLRSQVHPTDMRGYQEIDLVYAQSSQGSNWTAPTRVYERTLAFRRPNEDGVCLPHVEERDPD